MEPRLCHCDLSGDVHVVTFDPRTCCELCKWLGTEEFNTVNVAKALKYLAERKSNGSP